jgi:hypothetical protein
VRAAFSLVLDTSDSGKIGELVLILISRYQHQPISERPDGQ